MLTAKPVTVRQKAMLFPINKLYRSDMTPLELYEATPGFWRVSRRKDQADYPMAVYQGIVREVYRIEKWYPAGTLDYKTRDSSEYKGSGRWEFEGEIADRVVRDEYVNFSVGKGGKFPIRFCNC